MTKLRLKELQQCGQDHIGHVIREEMESCSSHCRAGIFTPSQDSSSEDAGLQDHFPAKGTAQMWTGQETEQSWSSYKLENYFDESN